jgi:hypothetical protein
VLDLPYYLIFRMCFIRFTLFQNSAA